MYIPLNYTAFFWITCVNDVFILSIQLKLVMSIPGNFENWEREMPKTVKFRKTGKC